MDQPVGVESFTAVLDLEFPMLTDIDRLLEKMSELGQKAEMLLL